MGNRLIATKYLQIVFFIVCQYATGQIVRPPYCKCEMVGEPIFDKDKIGVFAKAHYDNENLQINIFNNTKDTIFLFKSYFEKDISKSKYIYRYHKKKQKVKISFLPIIPYLYTRYSDKIIFQDRIIEEYQTVYDFYKLPPFYKYSINIEVLNLKNKRNYIKDVVLEHMNKFQKPKKFKPISLKKNTNVNYSTEVAYYTDVTFICNEKSYFLEELNFNEQAKSYYMIEIPIDEG